MHADPNIHPPVQFEITGAVAKAGGLVRGHEWHIRAEAEAEDRARCVVVVDGRVIADITVHPNGHDLAQEAQDICAALLWSHLRFLAMRGEG